MIKVIFTKTFQIIFDKLESFSKDTKFTNIVDQGTNKAILVFEQRLQLLFGVTLRYSMVAMCGDLLSKPQSGVDKVSRRDAGV